MREIFLAHLGKPRPCLILTRAAVLHVRNRVTIAGITSHIRGTTTEVPVGAEEGINLESVINFDDIQTIPVQNLIRPVGFFPSEREPELTVGILAAFDLESTDRN